MLTRHKSKICKIIISLLLKVKDIARTSGFSTLYKVVTNIKMNKMWFILDFCSISEKVISEDLLHQCNYLSVLQDIDAAGTGNNGNQGKSEEKTQFSVYSEWVMRTLN